MSRESRCHHDPAEQETAVFADRLCPLCLDAENERLRVAALDAAEYIESLPFNVWSVGTRRQLVTNLRAALEQTK